MNVHVNDAGNMGTADGHVASTFWTGWARGHSRGSQLNPINHAYLTLLSRYVCLQEKGAPLKTW